MAQNRLFCLIYVDSVFDFIDWFSKFDFLNFKQFLLMILCWLYDVPCHQKLGIMLCLLEMVCVTRREPTKTVARASPRLGILRKTNTKMYEIIKSQFSPPVVASRWPQTLRPVSPLLCVVRGLFCTPTSASKLGDSGKGPSLQRWVL